MGVIQRVVKPKRKRSQRGLEAREPKAIENTKSALFIRGLKSNETLKSCLKDLCALKKPFVQVYSKKNEIRPFEDINKIEILSQKSDSSLFLFANTNKKRPDNLVFGRMYDGHLLDMIEVGLQNFKGLSHFKNEKIASTIKPILTFSGSAFETVPEMTRMKSLLVDFFRGPQVDNVRLNGLEHAIQFTAVSENKIAMRSYKVFLKKSDNPKKPRIELEEIGPSMDFKLRRTHLASDELTKTAEKQVKNLYKPKKVKNITKDDLDNTIGRVHIPSQQISKIQTRKMKGLKPSEEEKKAHKEEKEKKRKEKSDESHRQNVEDVFMETD